MNTTPRHAASLRWLLTIFAILSIAGIVVSVELTRIHMFVHTDPDYHSVCAVSDGINCETVAVSPYSVFAGLPVSVWGILGYSCMLAMALFGLHRNRPHPTWPMGILLTLAGVSIGASAVLAFISATRIDSLCLFCTASYVINTILFILAVRGAAETGAPYATLVLRDLNVLFSRPLVTAAIGTITVASLTALYLLYPAYWKVPGWSDLPNLPSGTDADGNHWIGARHPKLTIVEFSDYECPHCRNAHKSTRSLAARYPDRIRLIHRHFPLDMACNPKIVRRFHDRACEFAIASECAGKQDQFWEMNDALFSIQDTIKTQDVDILDIAVRLGLNRKEFRQCFENQIPQSIVSKDVEQAISLGLRGTPSFLIENKQFTGRIPESAIKNILDPPESNTTIVSEANRASQGETTQ